MEEILAQADELADKLEQNDNPGEGSLAWGAIHNAVVAHSRSEAKIVKAVTAARVEGRSWKEIGTYLRTSGEAARQKYGEAAQNVG